jgi:hypothetical protein
MKNSKLANLKLKNPVITWAKEMKKHFTENIWMANEHMK